MGQQLQDNDLVPLSLAASLAYFELTGLEGRVGSEEHLRDVIDLAAVALVHVAPIYRANAGAGRPASLMSAGQADELLFTPIRKGKAAPPLDRFYIRRGDLRAAIASLRPALASSAPVH